MQAHFDGTLRVVWSGCRQSTNAVIAVSEQFDSMAMVFLREKSSKYILEHMVAAGRKVFVVLMALYTAP